MPGGRKYGIGDYGMRSYDLGSPVVHPWVPVSVPSPIEPWVPIKTTVEQSLET
jgi:hypothetical protein